ncbi:MAG TPA: PKD domain-containing protein [Anaerolineae bacterium]|nr:PKD domain-containing protein [Anaerolineae bacterium]
MERAKKFPILFLTIASLSILLAACSADASEETPGQATSEAVEAATPEATSVTPEEAVESEPDATPEDEADGRPESSNPGLTAVIVSGESAGAGKPFTFDGTQTDPGELDIVNYQWNMGDGTTLFGVSIQHAYEEPGLYTVTLTVVDEQGNTDVAAQVVEIVKLEEEPPIAGEATFTLVGTKWTLNYPLRGTTLTLEFGEETITGSAGCNTFSAGYTADVTEGVPTDISINAVAISSAKLCTAEIMAQEDGYLDSLASASNITVEAQKLTLETGSGTLIFSQVEVAG